MKGTLITFYSFKGGVGRTQALANVAVALANQGRRVIVVDMDLESPGLHTFFFPMREATLRWSDVEMAQKPGLLDYLEECFAMPSEAPRGDTSLVPCHHPSLLGGGEIRLLPPGRLDANYPRRVSAFSWQAFYEERQGYRYMELLRRQLFEAGADFVLLDSRTGLTDVGMVCTFQLPDVIVVPFALHRQGIDGAKRIARAIQLRRQEGASGTRLRHVLLIPSRVDQTAEIQALDMWLNDARASLEGCGELLSGLDERLPYVPRYAFGEHIAVAPDSEPNPLSRAYDRLATKLAELASQSALAETLEPRATSLSALRSSWERLKERLDGFVSEARRLDPLKTRIEDLPRWVSDMVTARRELVDSLQHLGQRLAHLSQSAGLEPAAYGGLDAAVPETPASIGALVPAYTRALSLLSKKVSEHRQLAHKRLLSAADGDELQIEKVWHSLKSLFDEARLVEAERLLSPLEEELSRTTLSALLRRNALEEDRLRLRFPQPEDMRSWLEDRLQQTVQVQEGTEEETRAILWNLLRLQLPLLQRPTRTHWAAYDIVCLLVSHEPSGEDRQLFAQIGRGLWEREWTALLTPAQNLLDVDDPAGPEAREQLQRMSQMPGELDSIAACIARGLMEHWDAAGASAALATLFRKRSHDPSLRAAMLQLARNFEPLLPRRALLSLWLQGAVNLAQERSLVLCLLEILVLEDLRAEAFFSAVAFTQRDLSLDEEERLSSVQVAFALYLLRTGRLSPLQALIERFRASLARSRPGRGLLMMLAARLQPNEAAHEELEAAIRQFLLYFEADSPSSLALRPWLEWLERLRGLEDGELDKARELLARLEGLSGTHFYGSWVASQHYEADFRELTESLRTRLLEGQESPRTFIEFVRRLDAKRWMSQSYQRQKAEGLRTNYPERQASINIQEAFKNLAAYLEQLGHLRERIPAEVLRQLPESTRVREAARTSLVNWLRPQPSDSQADRALLMELTALLRQEGA